MSADFSWSSVHRELDAGLTLVQGSSQEVVNGSLHLDVFCFLLLCFC